MRVAGLLGLVVAATMARVPGTASAGSKPGVDE